MFGSATDPPPWQTEGQRHIPAGTPVLHQAQATFRPLPLEVHRARVFVDSELTSWADPDLRADVLLLTSELVTNAVIHARTELTLRLLATEDDVVITVHDLDLGRREQAVGRDGGRGLGIVRSLSCDSGQTSHPGDGKTAWFRVCRDDHHDHSIDLGGME